MPAFLAALLGLGLNYAAYESEIYRGALEAIPAASSRPPRCSGSRERQTLRLVRGPQAFRLALAPMTNDFVAMLKDSSLVSVLTVVELTKQTQIFATNIGSWVVPGVAVRRAVSGDVAAARARRAAARSEMEGADGVMTTSSAIASDAVDSRPAAAPRLARDLARRDASRSRGAKSSR